MGLYDEIDKAFKDALKAQETLKLSTLRMLRTALKNREVQEKRKLSDEEIISVISSQVKQRRESITEYQRGGRTDLAQKEEEELTFLLIFLPAQLSESELQREVTAIIQEVGASGPQDLGRVMKAAMQRLAGKAEGKVINTLVKQHLHMS